MLLLFFFLFRNIFSLETIWLHNEGNSDLVEPDPYNFRVCVEKNGMDIGKGGLGEEEKKLLSKRKTKQRIASIHFVTAWGKCINVKLFIFKNCHHISFSICHIAINKVSTTNCIELHQCPMSFLCTLFFPQVSNFWENVVTSFYLTSQAKIEFKWQLLSLTNSGQFPNEMQADGWMNNHKLTIDFCILCEGC